MSVNFLNRRQAAGAALVRRKGGGRFVTGGRDFTQGSISRSILRMALPMTAAQLINILYNIVDRMYLGRLPGHLALTGLGL